MLSTKRIITEDGTSEYCTGRRLMQHFIETLGLTDEWVIVPTDFGRVETDVDEASHLGRCPGVTMMTDKKSGKIVFLSTRNLRDSDRWNLMPSVEPFKESLLVLDLHKSRYIQGLHESVGDLTYLKHLMITSCASLRTLPESIGSLPNLEEVGYSSFHLISEKSLLLSTDRVSFVFCPVEPV